MAGLYTPAIVDLFAGAGGASIGIERACVRGGLTNRYVDLMVNHWDVAVGVHELNHPMTEHLHASVWEVDPNSVLLGRRIAALHASPDCTDFSKAKGSKPRRKQIRALADVVLVWAGKRRPDVITLENVEEFKDWGPLGPDGQPDKARRGDEFRRWKGELESLGYVVEHRELRACDYGAPTTRKRLFVIARCDGKPIVWPEKTHGSQVDCGLHADRKGLAATRRMGGPQSARGRGVGLGNSTDMDPSDHLDPARRTSSDSSAGTVGTGSDSRYAFDSGRGYRRHQLKPYRTAASCIEWDIPMLSIFATREEAKVWAKLHGTAGIPQRPLKPKTMERIARGLVKFVLNAQRPFIVDIENSKWAKNGTRDVAGPLNTVTAMPKGGKHAVVDATLAPVITEMAHGEKSRDGSKGRWGQASRDAQQPIGTVSGSNNHAVVGATLAPYTVPNLGEREGQAPRCGSVEQPLPTVTAKGNGARLVAATLSTLNHAGPEHRAQSPDEPIHTVTSARDARALVAALVTKHYSGVVGSAADAPIDTVTGTDHNAVTCAYLSHFYTSNTCGGEGNPEQPAKTITSGGQHAAVTVAMASPVESPKTQAADRRDLVAAFLSTYYGNTKDAAAIDKPSPTVTGKDRIQLVTVVIDGQTYVITDIAMRMLTPRELARCQGFGDEYVIERTAGGRAVTKADQVKLIGNSVPPAFTEAIYLENVVKLGVLEEEPTRAGRVG